MFYGNMVCVEGDVYILCRCPSCPSWELQLPPASRRIRAKMQAFLIITHVKTEPLFARLALTVSMIGYSSLLFPFCLSSVASVLNYNCHHVPMRPVFFALDDSCTKLYSCSDLFRFRAWFTKGLHMLKWCKMLVQMRFLSPINAKWPQHKHIFI